MQKLEAVAKASENPKLILEAEKARLALERLRSESDLLQQKFDSIFQDALSSGMEAFRTELQKSGSALKALGAGFKSFADGVVSQINKIVQAELATKIAKATGMTGGGGSGGMGSLVGMFARMLVGGGATFDTSTIAIDAIDTGPGYAEGTDFVPRTGYYKLHEGEKVLTRQENSSGAWGVPAVNITLNGVRDFESFRRSRSQLAVREARELQRARRGA